LITALPPIVAPYRRTPEFTQDTVPAGLLRGHSTKAGVWGLIHVLEGRLRYRILGDAPEETVLEAGTTGVVVPQQLHEVEPLGAVRFYVEFHSEPEQPR
jgi:tellurite resistance-related uncharacterized protein